MIFTEKIDFGVWLELVLVSKIDGCWWKEIEGKIHFLDPSIMDRST